MFARAATRRRQRHKQSGAAAPLKPVTWDESDKRYLQQVIDPLHNSFKVQPFGFLRAEATTLLCTPPDEVYDRLTTFLTNCGIVAGLVLSAIAGAALNPFNPKDFPEDQRVVVEAFNVVLALATATQLGVVMWSVFTLYILIASAHSPEAIYKALLHMNRWIGWFEFLTFVPALLTFVLICLATYLRCGPTATWIVCGFSVVFFATMQTAFCYMCSSAFPYNAWAWATMSTNGAVLHPLFGLREKAQNHGALLVAQAKEGALAGLDENDDYVLDEKSFADAHGSFAAWLGSVLPWNEARRRLLAEQLTVAGLTREAMAGAVQLEGGFQALCQMLSTMERAGLRPGDRLILATAVAKGCSCKPHGAVAMEC